MIDYTILSPNHSGKRTSDICRITPHCVAGQLSAETVALSFQKPSRRASANYIVGKDGEVALCVPEDCRSWCSSNANNDQKAVTIECASDIKAPYAMNGCVWDKLVALCIDICKRNSFKKLIWIPDKEKALKYKCKEGECLITVHRWFANKECPGDWLYSRLGDLASIVTYSLKTNGVTYYHIQCGAFQRLERASKLEIKLKAEGYDAEIVEGTYYYVMVGSYTNKHEAQKVSASLNSKGYYNFIKEEKI